MAAARYQSWGKCVVALALLLWLSPVALAQEYSPAEAALQAYAQGDLTGAVRLLLQALQAAPEDASLYYYLGRVYYDQRLYHLAQEALGQSAAKYGDAVPADVLYALALAAWQAGEVESAQDQLNRLLSDATLTPELRERADSLLLTTLQAQSSTYPEAVAAYSGGDYARAASLFLRSLGIFPESAEINYYLGASYYQLQDYQQARAYLQKVVALSPESELGLTAKLSLDVIEKLLRNAPAKPFYFNVALGNLTDSNVNYGGPSENTPSIGGQVLAVNSQIFDQASVLNLSTGYQFSPEWGLHYNYLLNVYWGLENRTDRPVNSYDFNLQLHQLSLRNRLSLTPTLELGIETQGKWEILAGQSYILGGYLRPTLTAYTGERLVTRLNAEMGAEIFPVFRSRDNLNYSLGLDQFIYLWSSRSWLRFSYLFGTVNARDFLQVQRGINGDGSLYELSFRFANSRALNQLSLAMGFPLGPIEAEIGTSFSFTGYTQPDVFKQSLIRINPLTGLPLPPQELGSRSVEKLREDTLLNFYIQAEWPLANNWKLLARYNRLTNVSNIVPDDYAVSRSYLKDLIGINLLYQF